LYNIYKTSDNLPNGKVWDMYSIKADGTANYYYSHGSATCGSYKKEGDCYNREHTFCDSWLGNATPQRSDAHHLIPTDGYVNNRRSSFPHGKVKTASWTSSNGSKLGTSDPATGYSGTVFEPIDEFKGDFARMYFYVATRYESKIGGWANNGSANQILAGNSYPAYKSWFYTLMLAWNSLDPVSTKEINRNNIIYRFQNNRNPFIDYPELAEHIWGNKVGQPWNVQGGDFPYISAPVYGQEIDFGKVAYGNNRSTTLHVKASNLTGNLTLSLTGTNASDFTVSTQTIEKTQAESGFDVTVTYNAVSVGAKAAVLNIAGGGVTSVSVPLKALSSDEFMALPASNVSHSGFTANWTVSATAQNYSLNVFTLESDGSTQPAVLLEESFDNGMPALWDAGGFTEVKDGSVRMASGGSNGSISTPPMDLSTSGMVLTVKAKRYGTDSNADITVSIDNGEVTKWTTEASSKEFSITLDEFSDASVITFSAASGRRVFIESVKLEIPAEVYRPVSVAGFPVETGNILTYPVNGLLENTLYYYSVTALGNDAKESERIAVETQSANAVDKTEKNNTLWIRTQSGVQLKNMSDNYQITVTDLLGKKVFTQSSSSPELHISLPQKGLYLLRIQHNQQSETIKILY
jgi:endonuclease I